MRTILVSSLLRSDLSRWLASGHFLSQPNTVRTSYLPTHPTGPVVPGSFQSSIGSGSMLLLQSRPSVLHIAFRTTGPEVTS